MARTSSNRAAVNKAKVVQAASEDIKTEANETVKENGDDLQKRAFVVKQTDLDPNMYVPVRNGFNGKLIYKSTKTGERYVWERFGEEQDMELRELRAAKTSYKAFFENNWFMIDDPEVIAYLGVERFYENALKYDEFATLFEKSPEEIEDKLNSLSKGQKASVAYMARRMIRDGGIDSIKVINTIEKTLNIVLIER